MKQQAHLILASLLGLGAVTAVVAQTVEGLDIGAISRRADAGSEDAARFVAEVSRRGEALRDEAQDAAARGDANLARQAVSERTGKPTGGVDFDAMIKGIAGGGDTGQAPQLIVFASLSMPPEVLRPLLADTSKAGGIVVFQGFPNNSVKAFSEGLSRVIDKGDKLEGIGIDPRLFRAFHVRAVPTYVAVSSDFDLCDGLTCTTQTPPHDMMSGNVTLRYVLESFAGGGGPGALVAKSALKSLNIGA